MKNILLALFIGFSLLAACKSEPRAVVSQALVDSIISGKIAAPALENNTADAAFWKARLNPKNGDLVNLSSYAHQLTARFMLTGNIQDLRAADSLLESLDVAYNHTQTSVLLGLMHNAISQHKFLRADSLYKLAKTVGLPEYATSTGSFDAAFELGQYDIAKHALASMVDSGDYGYEFRKAKFAHYEGDVDAGIASMLRAVELSGDNLALRQAALSNAADLYMHNAEISKAYELYAKSIRLSASDMHSIMGIAWLALVHDKKPKIAEQLLRYVQTKTQAPDVLYKLEQLADYQGDTVAQKKYATEFVTRVEQPVYGNMYNKYTIQLYTGILNNPSKATAIAHQEIIGRPTPQSYAWLVYALLKEGKKDEAYSIFKKEVSGKPLEGLELYYMGKLMQAEDKGYNAQQFMEKAHKNRFDLTPGMMKDVEESME